MQNYVCMYEGPAEEPRPSCSLCIYLHLSVNTDRRTDGRTDGKADGCDAFKFAFTFTFALTFIHSHSPAKGGARRLASLFFWVLGNRRPKGTFLTGVQTAVEMKMVMFYYELGVQRERERERYIYMHMHIHTHIHIR